VVWINAPAGCACGHVVLAVCIRQTWTAEWSITLFANGESRRKNNCLRCGCREIEGEKLIMSCTICWTVN